MPILPVLVSLYGVVTLVSLVRRAQWPVELLTHLRPQMIAAGLAGAALCLALGERWEWAGIAFGMALINWAALPSQAWLKPEERLAAKPGLTVVWANVWQKRQALERTLAWAKAQDADLIIVGEFPDVNAAEMLASDYPHRLDTGAAPARGYAVRMVAFSRTPITDGVVRDGPGPMLRPFLSMSVDVGGAPLTIVGVHPVPPYRANLLAERDAHIGLLAPLLKAPFVLAGDFNTTPWCPGYAGIPGRRVGAYLFAPTWLTGLPLLGLPIDHIMVSESIKASTYRVAPFLGSDHRAILARIHLSSGAAT